MIRRPPRSTQSRSSAASDVYKRQFDNLLPSAGAAAELYDWFASDPQLGIVVPPVIHMYYPTMGHAWLGNRDLAEGLADRCLLYTSDAADDLLCVDLGGRRII